MKSTQPGGTEICPRCGKVGQKKVDIRNPNCIRVRFDHYGHVTKAGVTYFSKLHRHFLHTCYIGVVGQMMKNRLEVIRR